MDMFLGLAHDEIPEVVEKGYKEGKRGRRSST